MNKKIFRITLLFLILLECSCVFLMYKSFINKEIISKKDVQEIDKKMFAMYTEQDDGSYVEYSGSSYFPSSGYRINLEKSNCVDNKGNKVEDVITGSGNKITASSNKTVFCYLYFDLDKSVYAKVMSDYTNSNGALLLSETENDEYPVYYYSGNITNNNILYGNFCWKMVRTTETGGVKLIYNGVPDESEDGTLTCDNTGKETIIGTNKFNPGDSLAYVGYMYNSVFNSSTKALGSWGSILTSRYNPDAFYYADTITWNGAEYELSNKDGSEITTHVWSENYTNLLGKYTCLSTTATSCKSVSYVAVAGSSTMYYYNLSSGNDYNYYNLKYATEVISNEDGTYTLVNPIEVTRAEYYENYSNYINHYYCGDNISETCSNMFYLITANSSSFIGYNIANVYKYGNSFEYKDGKYTLVNPIEFWNWSENYTNINNNHYTCFNTTGTCENVYYIYNAVKEIATASYVVSSKAYYITLSGAKTVEDAINEMLYAENVNETNSLVKDAVDTWYEENIMDVVDSNTTLYSAYLENTIWCNSREITNLGGFNPNGGDITKALSFNSNAFECTNKTDQFTLKVESSGTEGYGNNALDYPISLITSKEVSLASPSGYIKNSQNTWTLSPGSYPQYENAGINFLNYNGVLNSDRSISSFAIRPAVSLANKVEITEGDGSVSAPYQVILPS